MPINDQDANYDIEVWTEGKTDWKILKRALSELDTNLKIKFYEFDKDMGHDQLVKKCEHLLSVEIPSLWFLFLTMTTSK